MNSKLESVIKTIANAENLVDYSVTTSNGSLKGDGFMGEITCVKLIEKTIDGVKPKTFNFIVKSAPKGDAVRELLQVVHFYITEIYMYKTTFPSFTALEIGKGQQPSVFTPKFYNAICEDKCESVILENLKEIGYQMHPLLKHMDDNHINLVMKQYGRFHAISFALHDQKPAKYNEIAEKLEDKYFDIFFETFRETMMSVAEKSIAALHVKTEAEALSKMRHFVDNVAAFYEEIKQIDTDKYCAILHGDCWNNNLMFQYADENNPKMPTSMRLLDFQVSRVGPPAIDLANFFYCTASKHSMATLDSYLKIYYKSFSDYLIKLGSSPDLYPLMPITIQMAQVDSSKKVDLESLAESKENFGNCFDVQLCDKDAFNERVRNLVFHFIENDFI